MCACVISARRKQHFLPHRLLKMSWNVSPSLVRTVRSLQPCSFTPWASVGDPDGPQQAKICELYRGAAPRHQCSPKTPFALWCRGFVQQQLSSEVPAETDGGAQRHQPEATTRSPLWFRQESAAEDAHRAAACCWSVWEHRTSPERLGGSPFASAQWVATETFRIPKLRGGIFVSLVHFEPVNTQPVLRMETQTWSSCSERRRRRSAATFWPWENTWVPCKHLQSFNVKVSVLFIYLFFAFNTLISVGAVKKTGNKPVVPS